jgi:hypothetical protein
MRSFLLALAALPMLAAPLAAEEQTPACGDRHDVLAKLKTEFHETPSAFGLTEEGAVVELMTSDNGSWTLLLSFPGGRSCLIALGNNWEGAKPKPPGRDA